MAHAETTEHRQTTTDALFKSDRPRSIDRFIDYFEGRPAGDATGTDDACGETLLDALGDDDTESGAA